MPETIQRSFTGGELSPELQSRADIGKYTTGLAKCDNFIIKSQGSVVTRPGFQYLHSITTDSTIVKMVPFEYSSDDTFMLVFNYGNMYVMKNGSLVFTLASSWFASYYLSTMTTTQAGNILFISSGKVGQFKTIKRLIRVADNDWQLEDFYEAIPDKPVVLGSTAGGAGAGDHDKKYYYKCTWVNEFGIESEVSDVHSITTKSLSTTAYISVSMETPAGTTSDQLDHFRLYKSTDGDESVFGLIGEVYEDKTGGTPSGSFRDYNYAPDNTQSANTGSTLADLSSLSSSLITPHAHAMAFYQQRFVMGNLLSNINNESFPFSMMTSQIDKYNRFEYHTPSRDDDAISVNIASRKIDEIRHIIDMDGLLVLTAGAIHRITDGQDEVLTPTTAGARVISYSGSSTTSPVVLNDSIIYVQDKGSTLRDFSPVRGQGITSGVDLSIMAEHLFRNHNIVSIAYAEEPYSIVWCLRDDGVLLGLTYQKEHQVWAWHQHHYANNYEVLGIQTVKEGDRDSVYAVIRKSRDSTLHIERMAERIADNPPPYPEKSTEENTPDILVYANYAKMFTSMDSHKYFQVPAPFQPGDLVVSGFDHLEGLEVVVVHSVGVVIKGLTVTGGQITIPEELYQSFEYYGEYVQGIVGLPYTCTLETLALDSASMQETLKTKEMSVSEVTIETLNSRGGSIGSLDYTGELVGDMQDIKPRSDSDGYDGIRLKSFKQHVRLSDGWDNGGKVRIQQTEPLPLTITSIIPELDISG